MSYGDRFLLKLLVRKEIKVRYRGSVLGLLWSYVKPLVQFLIYFVALGIFLNLQRGTPNYAIYLFSGIVLVNFFTESLVQRHPLDRGQPGPDPEDLPAAGALPGGHGLGVGGALPAAARWCWSAPASSWDGRRRSFSWPPSS